MATVFLQEIEAVIQQFLREHPANVLDTDPREKIIELCEQAARRKSS
jgi:hypothetical protein